MKNAPFWGHFYVVCLSKVCIMLRLSFYSG